MSDTPKGPVAFRYNAAAYECGIIRREEGVCDVCGRPREWFYTGAVYCAGPAPRVCDFFPYCCDDYCTFLGDVGTEELEAMGIADAVFADYEERGGDPRVREVLQAVGETAGYLFRCLHCGAYHLYVDRE